jgi:DNA/RNA endonuclease G (NUC1)
MKKLIIFILIPILLGGFISLQTIGTEINPGHLTIKHCDMTLYLDVDTNTFISRLDLKYSNFQKLDSDRDNKWFQDTYKGIYSKQFYLHSGYDLGHLTPSHITSYNDTLNHSSFSLFNQAPQLAAFNRGKWAQLEGNVEDTIAKYKVNVTIITGVIYNNKNKTYLGKSRIKIPISYYKILSITTKKLLYVWVGSNINGEIIPINMKQLNEMLAINKNKLYFK